MVLHYPLRLFRSAGLVAMLLVALLGGCARQPAGELATAPPPPATPAATAAVAAGRGAGGTLRLFYWQAPTLPNPHLSTAVRDWEASRLTYEPLASFDEAGTLVPFLAAEIPSLANGSLAPDNRWVTWKLKPGLRWSDGAPFTAEDVRFTYQFITNAATASTSAGAYDAVASVDVLDAASVKVSFKYPNPAWSLPFVGITGMIIPQHLFADYNGANAKDAPANYAPAGTGPYRLVEIKPQEILFLGNQLVETNKITYEANPFFRDPEKPFFQRVELHGGGTVNEAARQVLQSGDVDFSWNLQLSADTLAQIGQGGRGQLISNLGARVERILINRTDPNRETPDGERSNLAFTHPFFSDKRVRQAFAHAIDRAAIARLYGPSGQATENILVAPPQYRSSSTFYAFDLAKARQLLDEAGWVDASGSGVREKDGVRLSVLFQTSVNPLRQQTQAIIKQGLEAIGVEVQLKIIDVSVFGRREPTNTDSFYHFYADMQEFFSGSQSPDLGAFVKGWTCNQIPQKANNWSGGSNFERWCNAEYDALYQQSLVEIDPAKRRQLFMQMNDLLVEDVVTIPLVHLASVSGISNSLTGVKLTPWDAQVWDIQNWRRSAP